VDQRIHLTVGLDQEDFSRIHNVVGVNRPLDREHKPYSLAVLGEQEIDLAAADAVLTCAGAVERQRAMDHSLVKSFGLRHLFRIARIEHEDDVKIAVTSMANDRAGRKEAARSFCVSVMHSASREIGTQTSVTQSCPPSRSALSA
jgi:hypothetical protein